MAEGLPDIYNENWVGDTITDYERNILQKPKFWVKFLDF
jgi:hypothetical protein